MKPRALPSILLVVAPLWPTPALPAPAPLADLGPMVLALEAGMNGLLQGAPQGEPMPLAMAKPTAGAARTFSQKVQETRSSVGRLDAIRLEAAFYEEGERIRTIDLALHPTASGGAFLRIAEHPADDKRRQPRNEPLALDDVKAPLSPLADVLRQVALRIAEKKCEDVPLVEAADVARIVPAVFLDDARTRLEASRAFRDSLCAEGGIGEHDEVRLVLDELDFNLYDASGAIVGGVVLQASENVDGQPAFFAPQFKELPPVP